MSDCAMPGCHKKLQGGIHLTCKYCGDKAYCELHRLPEDHACSGYRNMVCSMREALKAQLQRNATAPKKREIKI